MFPEDVWEEYAMGMPSAKQSERLEEHLLICPTCQDLLAQADEYIRVARDAAALQNTRNRAAMHFVPNQTRSRLSKPAKAATAWAAVSFGFPDS
jgi:hypothetical protein